MRFAILTSAALAVSVAPLLGAPTANAASPTTNLGPAVTEQGITPARYFEDNSGRWREKKKNYYEWRRRVFPHHHRR
jgi:hypothetical protein